MQAEHTPTELIHQSIAQVAVFIGTFIAIAFASTLLTELDSLKFFELATAAIGGIASIKYKWRGILGVALGAFSYHLLTLTWDAALCLAVCSGFTSFLFSYLLDKCKSTTVNLNQVTNVVRFALIITPAACAFHTISSQLVLVQYGLVPTDGITAASALRWLDEIIIAYLAVPLFFSFLAYKKKYFDSNETTELSALVLGMLAATWASLHFGQVLGVTAVLTMVLLVFVLWASVRFDSLIGHCATSIAAILVFTVIVIDSHGGSFASDMETLFLAKIGLIAMMLGGLFVVAAFAERNQVEAQLSKLANHDPLTGLPNRSYLHDFFNYNLSQAQRQKQQLYLLFIDLDRFKKINDSQGHDVGDEVLKIIAHRLDSLLRGDDFVARLGGDEFAMLYAHPAINKAANNLAKKILEIIAQPFEIGERSYAISASIGISVYPNDSEDASTLLRQADLAMYQAKGKQSGFEYFSEEMNILAHEQLQLESDLRNAIKNKELRLVYQPKLDLHSNLVVGLEALVRWVTKDGRTIGPDKFIPIAEDVGLILPIGRYVIQEACEQWVKWHQAGLNPPSIAINISPRQFSDPLLIKDISESIKSTGMEPSKLVVEITESATMDDPELTLETLVKMHELELPLYIDDFGTGFSNLGQLKRFPIDALKIDKVFVNEILTNLDDAEIVNAIINMAHALKLRVVCEGVETKAQFTLLKGLGCDEIQGYLIAKPLSPDQVIDYFNKVIAYS